MKKLTKSRDNKVVSGVLAGIAEYFGIDPSILRIIFAVATFFGIGSPIFLYIILAVVIPEAPRDNGRGYSNRSYTERKRKPRREAEKIKEDEWSDF